MLDYLQRSPWTCVHIVDVVLVNARLQQHDSILTTSPGRNKNLLSSELHSSMAIIARLMPEAEDCGHLMRQRQLQMTSHREEARQIRFVCIQSRFTQSRFLTTALHTCL